MPFIIIAIIVLYLVFVAWTWYNLGNIEKTKKIYYLGIGVFLTFVITLILFQFSKNGISYINQDIEKSIRFMIIVLFTGLNGCVLLPFFAKIMEQLQEKEEDLLKLKKRIIVFLVLVIVICIFESGYMRSLQQGILQVVNSQIQ